MDLLRRHFKARFWSFSYSLASLEEPEIASPWSAGDPTLPWGGKLFSSRGAAAVPQGEVMRRA